jgi:hypothetical protein
MIEKEKEKEKEEDEQQQNEYDWVYEKVHSLFSNTTPDGIYNHSLTTNTKNILNIRCDISIKGNLELHCDDNSGYKINRTYIHTF